MNVFYQNECFECCNSLKKLKIEDTNKSIAPRKGNELWIELQKKSTVSTFLYSIQGITCIGCSTDITTNLSTNLPVESIHISSDFSIMTIVSIQKIELSKIQELLNYDAKYKVVEI